MSRIDKAKPSTHLITRPLLAGAVALSVLPAIDAQAAIFLQITGIQGESQDSKFKDAIVVDSFSDGFTNAVISIVGGPRVGRASCGPVQITKHLDTASLPLIDAVMTGKVYDKAVFSFTAPAGDVSPQPYYIVTLQNVSLSAFTQDSGGDRPSESLQFNFTEIQMKYVPYSATGKPGNPVTATVDCARVGGR